MRLCLPLPDEPPRLLPPDEPLSESEVTRLQRWIERGAPWPKESPANANAKLEAGRSHWAFQPLTHPPIPVLSSDQAIRQSTGPIDAFLFEQLANAKLPALGIADRRTLLKRLSYDLTGLPPSF